MATKPGKERIDQYADFHISQLLLMPLGVEKTVGGFYSFIPTVEILEGRVLIFKRRCISRLSLCTSFIIKPYGNVNRFSMTNQINQINTYAKTPGVCTCNNILAVRLNQVSRDSIYRTTSFTNFLEFSQFPR